MGLSDGAAQTLQVSLPRGRELKWKGCALYVPQYLSIGRSVGRLVSTTPKAVDAVETKEDAASASTGDGNGLTCGSVARVEQSRSAVVVSNEAGNRCETSVQRETINLPYG